MWSFIFTAPYEIPVIAVVFLGIFIFLLVMSLFGMKLFHNNKKPRKEDREGGNNDSKYFIFIYYVIV